MQGKLAFLTMKPRLEIRSKKFCLVDFTNNGVIPESGVVTLTMIRKDAVDVVD